MPNLISVDPILYNSRKELFWIGRNAGLSNTEAIRFSFFMTDAIHPISDEIDDFHGLFEKMYNLELASGQDHGVIEL